MEKEHELIGLVYAAKESAHRADELVRKYLPFIKKETASFLRSGTDGHEDALSIAMFAFHQAAMSYQREKGAFLPLAARAIRNGLIDYHRREKRHMGHLSLDQPLGEESDGDTVLSVLDTGHDPITQHQSTRDTREEILHFARELGRYGLELADIADNCPKQDRTLEACHKVLAYAKEHPQLLKQLEQTGKLPMAALSSGSGVDRKTMERHRKYLVAILLAYTNGFDIIRGHLKQMAPRSGGTDA